MSTSQIQTDSRNASRSETQSVQETLLNIDPTFARAVSILDKYMPNDDSNSIHVAEYNQNKAIGPDSDVTSFSQGNTAMSSNTSRRAASDLRGGSTLSDLHNTEYVDESKGPKSKLSPTNKTVNPPLEQSTPKVASKNVTPEPVKPPAVPKRSTLVQKVMPRSSIVTDIDETEQVESDSLESQPLARPDPSAERDLDTATPNTLKLCNRHPCHYCFFVYFSPSSVDDDLLPFRRKAFLDKILLLQDPEHIRDIMETKCGRDAISDRRIQSIERQSGTEIHLSELDPRFGFIKGLPRRRLTIAGPTFANIACALNLFDVLLPRLIKSAVFPYRLPEGVSTRFASGNRFGSTYQLEVGRTDGTISLRSQLDDKGGWRGFLLPK